MIVYRTMLALFAAALCLTPGHAMGAAEGGKIAQLLAQSRAALGGNALDHAGVVKIEAKVATAGLNGTATSWSEMGGLRFSELVSTPPVIAGDGYDGKSAWNSDESGLVWVDGGQAGRAQSIGQAFANNYALWSPNHGGATVVWGGTKTAGGHSYDALVVTPPNTTVPFEFWFDKVTHLPERSVLTVGPTTAVTIYSDYRPLAGVMLPRATHTDDGSGNTADVTVTQADANVPDGQAHLAKPASTVHDFSIAQGATQTSIPFDLVDNHVYLNVMLNGKGPYRFIFDTGGLNLIDPAVAQEIGAFGAGSAQGGGVGSGTQSISFAKVASLQAGDATVKDQLFFVAPTRQGFGITAGRPVDGLIGFEVLARFVTTFDYASNKVVLQMPGGKAPDGATSIPFVLDGRQPQFACSIDNIGSQCTLDTGSRDSISMMAPFMAEHPNVVPANVAAEGINGFGFGGPAMGKLGRILSLGIGTYTIANVVTDFTTQKSGAFAAPFLAGNVGGGVWKRFSLTLDYTAQTMSLLPNSNFQTPDAYERAGMFLINKDGTILVMDSRPGTPAAQAGILKGDSIATIDGKPTTGMTLQDIRRLFMGAPGTVLQLGLVGKDGTKRNATVTLRDFV
jgi:hypothetical protein